MIICSCPECDAENDVGLAPEIGQRVICIGCGKDLEVIWLYPLALDYAEEKIHHPLPPLIHRQGGLSAGENQCG